MKVSTSITDDIIWINGPPRGMFFNNKLAILLQEAGDRVHELIRCIGRGYEVHRANV